MRNLGGRDVQDNDKAVHPIPRNKGKELIVLDEVDAPVDDELSSGSSPSPNLSSAKNTRESARTRSCKDKITQEAFPSHCF